MVWKIKHHVFLLTLLCFGVVMAGCSDSAPKCSDSETVDLVNQIVLEELVGSLGQDFVDQVELSVDAIRTTDSNDKTGAQQCAAQLTLKGPNGKNSIEITYTSENTDNGEEFFVTVYGL